MNAIINDFLQLGTLSFIARILCGLRGLFIILNLTPQGLGEYTVWLLFVFYFSVLDLGALKGLERDVPHFNAAGGHEALRRTLNTGWSSYFILCAASSVLLTLVTFCVFGKWPLAFVLGLYLFFDKWYRAYDSNARIHLQYRDNGAAQVLNALVSLVFIWFFLPRLGTNAIFGGFIAGALISIIFLARVCPVHFKWQVSFKTARQFVAACVPLALVAYAIEFFHAAALTVLASQWDKATLGYFAFAFRIFQICLAIFPYLIQDVMRTRVYAGIAQAGQAGMGRLRPLIMPLGMYALVTVFFWLGVVFCGQPVVGRLAPLYSPSVVTLKILTLSLLPLGIAKVLGDYLCSRVHVQARWVAMAWAAGIALQAAGLMWGLSAQNMPWRAPAVYVAASMLVCVLITSRVVNKER